MTNPPDNSDTIALDPEKVLEALYRAEDKFLGKNMEYWAQVLTDHAQVLADRATIDEYGDWNIEELGYD